MGIVSRALLLLILIGSFSAWGKDLPPSPTRRGTGYELAFDNGMCIPESLERELEKAGIRTKSAFLAGVQCCPWQVRVPDYSDIPADLWRKVEPFIASAPVPWELAQNRCGAPRMSEEQAASHIEKYWSKKEAEQALEAAAAKKRQEDDKRDYLTVHLTLADNDTICTLYGMALRGAEIDAPVPSTDPDLAKALKLQVTKRKLPLDPKTVEKGRLRIGSSQCLMKAIMGQPDRANRTVTPNKSWTQFVYGSTYIYITNGVITSWQD